MQYRCKSDLSQRPHSFTLEKVLKANANDIYEAWTTKFDSWFGQPGETFMTPEVGRPFFFYNRHDWGRHAHYGRFTELERDKLVEMTWVTGTPGTNGTETVLRVELIPSENGTTVQLTQSGFEDEESCKGHQENWPAALDTLEEVLLS